MRDKRTKVPVCCSDLARGARHFAARILRSAVPARKHGVDAFSCRRSFASALVIVLSSGS